jgi:hypothetical protein
MGIKLEIILILLVAVIMSVALTVKISNSRALKEISTIELEFTDTTFREVDINKTLGISYGTYGVRDNGVLTVENFRYHNDSIKLLRSNIAIYKNNKIYLDHDVVFNQKVGSDYYTEHAIYDEKTEILHVITPYKAVMGKNIMHGDTLRYWTKENRAYSTNVNAVVFTKEK